MLDSQIHDSKGAPAYLVRASSQAALEAVLTNALKELGVSDAIGPWTSTDVTLNDKREIAPILDRVQALSEVLGQVKALLGDTGYFSAANVNACEAKESSPCCR